MRGGHAAICFAPADVTVHRWCACVVRGWQYIGAIGKGNANWFWTEADWMFEFVQSFIAAKSRPAVFSMSYAWSEIRQARCFVVVDVAAGAAPSGTHLAIFDGGNNRSVVWDCATVSSCG